MSSPTSPGLTTEGLARPLERVAVLTSLSMAAGLPWLAGVDRARFVSLLLAGMLVLAWRTVGWLGGPCAVRWALWDSQGVWHLRLGDGGTVEGHLAPGSRILGPWIHLVWRTARGRRSMLLGGLSQGAALRPLAARLRLEAGAAARAASVPGSGP